MKKIISLIVFTVAMIWTWNVINSKSAVGFETHVGIQTNFADLIKQTILKKKPNAQNIEILKIWTETLNDNKTKANFSYKYTDVDAEQGTVTQTIEGEAILHRDPTAAPDEDRWVIQQVKTTGDALIFEEGMVVGPGVEEPAAEPSAAPTEEKTTPEEHH